jgi:hypothetical protein
VSSYQIARAVQRLRLHGARPPSTGRPYKDHDIAVDLMKQGTVIDVTALRNDVVSRSDGLDIYEDTVLRPPWLNALLCYTMPDGLVVMMSMLTVFKGEQHDDWPSDMRWQPGDADDSGETLNDDGPPHVIDWDAVEYITQISYWVADDHGTSGPHYVELAAIDVDGALLDLRWIQVRPDLNREMWETALSVWLKATTFLNCTNVTIVTPSRQRQLRRQIERTGVDVTEIQVFSSRRSVRGARVPADSGGMPLSTVRGHVARYGPKFGRGLLFGKYEGEFWIPAHARGDAENGTHEQRYTIEP